MAYEGVHDSLRWFINSDHAVGSTFKPAHVVVQVRCGMVRNLPVSGRKNILPACIRGVCQKGKIWVSSGAFHPGWQRSHVSVVRLAYQPERCIPRCLSHINRRRMGAAGAASAQGPCVPSYQRCG